MLLENEIKHQSHCNQYIHAFSEQDRATVAYSTNILLSRVLKGQSPKEKGSTIVTKLLVQSVVNDYSVLARRRMAGLGPSPIVLGKQEICWVIWEEPGRVQNQRVRGKC